MTVRTWLRDGPPRLGDAALIIAGDDVAPPGSEAATMLATTEVPQTMRAAPSAPWHSWDEVHQVREALKAHRFLLLRRPEQLTTERQVHVWALLASPLGGELHVARRFVEDWYALWHDAAGQCRSLADAQTRYEAWRTQPEYQLSAPLRRVLERMTPKRFVHLSPFLRCSTWEAINNGAERAGRAFRHRQAPHFNLRATAAIEGAIVVAACQKKAALTEQTPLAGAHCGRGRPRRVIPQSFHSATNVNYAVSIESAYAQYCSIAMRK